MNIKLAIDPLFRPYTWGYVYIYVNYDYMINHSGSSVYIVLIPNIHETDATLQGSKLKADHHVVMNTSALSQSNLIGLNHFTIH